jgi:hypothetical protein
MGKAKVAAWRTKRNLSGPNARRCRLALLEDALREDHDALVLVLKSAPEGRWSTAARHRIESIERLIGKPHGG